MKKLKVSALYEGGMEILSKEQMKNVLGKMVGGSDAGYTLEYRGCNVIVETGVVTCDYLASYDGRTRDLCGVECEPGDGGDCQP